MQKLCREPSPAVSCSKAHQSTSESLSEKAQQGKNSVPPRHRMISSVLSPAVRLWLRSQVEQVDQLEVEIEGGDRQLLTGHIPQVSISAQGVIYQGLHLSCIDLTGTGIRVNLGQVIKGKPLRLLEVVPVWGELLMREAELNDSLKAPLLANAVTEFLVNLLRSSDASGLAEGGEEQSLNLQNLSILIGANQLTLSADLISVSGETTLLVIRTGLEQVSEHELQLTHPQWLPHLQAKRGLPLNDLHGFLIDLGSEVDIETLTLEPGQIFCQGKINVIP
ncbi:DUF2993 domain-containing protein [Leptolyngbya sp. FACHB-541]|nr:DUF2993 domain-containing protein [Leptolyngbya sp. FACHB-541]